MTRGARGVGAVALLLELSCIVGCASQGKASRAQKPELEVTSLGASFPGADEGRIELQLTLHRPEDAGRQVRATGLMWEAWVDHRPFAAGRMTLSAPVDPRGQSPLVLSLPVSYRHLEYRPGPTHVELRVRGTLDLLRDGSAKSIDFERSETRVTDGAPLPPAPLDAER